MRKNQGVLQSLRIGVEAETVLRDVIVASRVDDRDVGNVEL